ncbi:MAG: hypothetical protein V1720_16105 [bacterium]
MKSEMQLLIDRYFDGELKGSEEILMFTRLSQEDEARIYFKQMNLLKSSVQHTIEEFPLDLERNILQKVALIDQKKNSISFNYGRIANYISYAAAIVLLFLSIVFYNQSSSYRNELDTTFRKVDNQNKMIELLYNSLPSVEVDSEIENTIIIKASL